MIRAYLFLLAASAALTGCTTLPSDVEEVVHVEVCELLGNPAAFDHKLVQISGTVSRGFEDFTLSDESCKNQNTIWLEFGGRTRSEVVYCCGVSTDPVRRRSLTLEGIRTRLVQDRMFTRFQDLTQRDSPNSKVKSTVIGRYFSGTETIMPGGTFWMGYGHFGMASLLVIQQVLAVEPT